MLNLVFNLYLLREKGLELCSALQLRGNTEAKELPFIPAFLFYVGEEGGVLLTKRRPFLSQALSNPTARYKLLHCVQVQICAIAPYIFKFGLSRYGSR